jgi:hypothetical protein
MGCFCFCHFVAIFSLFFLFLPLWGRE